MDPIDKPAYHGHSAIRLIAHWHHGNESHYTEVVAYDTRTALIRLVPHLPGHVVDDAVRKLGRPNDVFTGFPYGGWSWFWIAQVWASDKRPAAEVVAAQHKRAADPYWAHWLRVNSTL